MNNIYITHNPKKKIQRMPTENNSNLTTYVVRKIGKQTYGRIPKILNVSVNGKQISSHISPNYQSLQTNIYQDSKLTKTPNNKEQKSLNLKEYIYRKYVSQASDYDIHQQFDFNPQMQKLVRLRKMFNQKFRNKSCCDAQNSVFSRKGKNKSIKKKQISEMIKITNPDIFASNFARKFQKQEFHSKNLMKKKLQLKSKLKNKMIRENLGKVQPQHSISIEPWEVYD